MTNDDLLIDFDEHGLWLPAGYAEGRVANDGAGIWYADYGGQGASVLLLHGGLGHSGNFAKQVPALRDAGYRVVAIDSRGHGHSTRDGRPYTYQLMAADVVAVMDHLGVGNAAIVGWSDGADIGLVMAHDTPARVRGVFFFACNTEQGVNKPFVMTETLGHCISRHQKDYAALSATPDDWDAFSEALGLMQRTEPNYTADDLAAITLPILAALSAQDEFITLEHGRYIGRTVPRGEFRLVSEGTHFAPIQRPDAFNRMVLDFLENLPAET
jgi:pimeloyl-ACP methyl ester carboxylesterase